MSLLSQIEAVAGRQLEIHFSEALRQSFGLTRREFYEHLERVGRQVDMREFVARDDRPDGPLLILVSDYRGGLLIQLWELRETNDE